MHSISFNSLTLFLFSFFISLSLARLSVAFVARHPRLIWKRVEIECHKDRAQYSFARCRKKMKAMENVSSHKKSSTPRSKCKTVKHNRKNIAWMRWCCFTAVCWIANIHTVPDLVVVLFMVRCVSICALFCMNISPNSSFLYFFLLLLYVNFNFFVYSNACAHNRSPSYLFDLNSTILSVVYVKINNLCVVLFVLPGFFLLYSQAYVQSDYIKACSMLSRQMCVFVSCLRIM